MVAPSAPAAAPYPISRRRVTLPLYQNSSPQSGAVLLSVIACFLLSAVVIATVKWPLADGPTAHHQDDLNQEIGPTFVQNSLRVSGLQRSPAFRLVRPFVPAAGYRCAPDLWRHPLRDVLGRLLTLEAATDIADLPA